MTTTSRAPNKVVILSRATGESNRANPALLEGVILSGARRAQSKDPDEPRLAARARAVLPRTCLSLLLLFALTLNPHPTQAQPPAISGQSIYNLTAELLAAAPKRYNGSPGHLAAEAFIKSHFKPEAAKGDLVTDEFTASTPAGPQTMRNYIVRYPGKREGIIVLASHYETNYPLRDINFVGANDGACTSALLIEIGAYLRTHPPQGYSVWLVFDDGEEAVSQWSDSDSLYGTRHLAAKWYDDGTLKRIRAFIVADMIGDKNLNILEEEQSTAWLRALLKQAAANTHHAASVFQTQGTEDDDHIPFLKRGVPSLDIIDVAYGPFNQQTGDYSYHHTPQDTLDKISPQSLQISADLLLELIHLINQR